MNINHMIQENSSAQVATAGEALIDLIRDSDGRLEACLGGAVYNLTRALARQGVPTMYLNPLSKDRFGRELAAGLLADGVHLASPQPIQQVTSLAIVGVDEHGHPDYSFYREGVADRTTSAKAMTLACAQARELSVVCTGALALSPEDEGIYFPWLDGQRQAGRTVVIDANLRPSVMPDLELYRRHVLAALQFADIIKVSDEDLECLDLSGASADERAMNLLHSSRAHLLALTLGAEGAKLLTRYGEVFHAKEMVAISPVDTVGAGDCFLAGFIASMLEQRLGASWGSQRVDKAQAKALLASAIASASLCVLRRGCVPPSRSEVNARVAAAKTTFS